MIRQRPQEHGTNSVDTQDSARKDPVRSAVELEALQDPLETGSENGRAPSIDEIRLRAYYRYMEREGGDVDELADWLEAESELRGQTEAGRAERRRGARP
jgi:hypothetical protein